MGPRVREDDERYVHSGVVPAKAGTHTPRLIVLAQGLTPSATTKAGGYGSSRSRGRQKICSFRRRPCESRDPYARAYRFGTGSDTFGNNKAGWLGVLGSPR